MLRKLKWAAKLLQSTTFILLLDKEATMSIPITDIDDLDSIILVSAQSKVLHKMRDDLDAIISEHDSKITRLKSLED